MGDTPTVQKSIGGNKQINNKKYEGKTSAELIWEKQKHRERSLREIKLILKNQSCETLNKLRNAEIEINSNIATLELIARTTDKAHLEIQRAEEYLATMNKKLRELMEKSAK